jgi:hypothetical protein
MCGVLQVDMAGYTGFQRYIWCLYWAVLTQARAVFAVCVIQSSKQKANML